MRIATWNVNSIGVRLPKLLEWLEARQPDVVALQETKVADSAFPSLPISAAGYESLPNGDGRWNGVAILSKIGIDDVVGTLPGHPEARFVSAQCGPLRATSVYVPNGRALGDPHYEYKLNWFASLRQTLDEHDPANPMVIMGDFNVALHDADVFNIYAFRNSTHVTEPERAALRALIDWGLVDVLPRPGKGDHPFTYWDYRAGMLHQDKGMRIDYVLATPSVVVQDAFVDREFRKGKLPSDHAPVVVDATIG